MHEEHSDGNLDKAQRSVRVGGQGERWTGQDVPDKERQGDRGSASMRQNLLDQEFGGDLLSILLVRSKSGLYTVGSYSA
jgi:hypothetical protein